MENQAEIFVSPTPHLCGGLPFRGPIWIPIWFWYKVASFVVILAAEIKLIHLGI